MTDLPHLQAIYGGICSGRHFSPEDGDVFDSLRLRYDDYREYFEAIGIDLVRHEREFFYVEAAPGDGSAKMLSRTAVFSFILIDHYGSQGQPIDEAIMGQSHFVNDLPHFAFDRYRNLLREVDVEGLDDLESVLSYMDRIGWIKRDDKTQFHFLRPFYRMFSKCIELSEAAAQEKQSRIAEESKEVDDEG